MNRYRVMLLGRNFLLSMDGKSGRYGFYAVRRVEANDTASAELRAIELVKLDDALRSAVLNDKADPPLIFLQEIAADNGENDDPGAGYTFFPEQDGGEACLNLDG